MRGAVCLLGLGLCMASAVQAQNVRSYRIDANSTKVIDLNLCSSAVRIKADGDNDTDLDYSIYDDDGRLVHSDNDSTDLTFATLRPRLSGGCVTYTMRVRNLGDVYNTMSLEMQDQGGTATANTGGGRNRMVAIHNHTAEAFTAIRFSNTADSDFGPNRMAEGEVQRARTNRTFDIDDGTGACRFDIQVTTSSGRKYMQRNIDVCAVSSVEFGTEISH